MPIYNNPDNRNDEYRNKKVIRAKVLWIVILFLVLIFLVMLFFLLDGPEKAGEKVEITPTPTAGAYREVTPTPTEEAVPTESVPTPVPTETPTPVPTESAGDDPDDEYTPWVADETEEKKLAGSQGNGFIPLSELFPNLSTYFKRDKVKGIELSLIYQNPELPSGCESVALTMVLNYYGFGLKKTEVCDKYMIYGDNFMTSFKGNPYVTKGGAIFAPGLTSVAERVIAAKESSLTAKDVTGTDLDTLIKDYIYRYVPVIIYCTVDYVPVTYYDTVVTYNGEDYKTVRHGHCVVLAGYDEEDGNCIIYDPISGVVKVPKDKLESVFNGFYKMAVVVE